MTLPNPLSSFKNWFISLLIIAVVVLWFTRGCGSNPPAVVTENKATNDSVAKLLAVVQQSNIHEGLLMEDSITKAADLKKKDIDLLHKQNTLDDAIAANSVLADAISIDKAAKDTANYYRNCDSLAAASKRVPAILDSFKLAIRLVRNIQEGQLANANSQKVDLRQQIMGYKSAYDLEKKQNDNLLKAALPTSKVYIGLEGFTCPIASGVGPGVMLADKVGRVYRLAGGMTTTGNYWIGASAYIKIQLHK